MLSDDFWGNDKSPMRENPLFRKYMEKYKLFSKEIDRLSKDEGYLVYEDVVLLKKLKKLKLSVKSELIVIREKLMGVKYDS